jgi:hypothetical protein
MGVNVACLVVQELQAGESLRVVCFARAIATDYVLVVPLPMRNLAPCQSPVSIIGRGSAFSNCLRSGAVHDLLLDFWSFNGPEGEAIDKGECSRSHALYRRVV